MTSTDPVKKLASLIKDIKFAMMTTVNPDGTLTSRPMTCQQVEFDGDIWFFASKTSGKISALLNDQHVNLAYAEPAHNKYVSVSGRTEIVDDKAKEKELWNPLYKAWFPEGLEDPNLVLLKVSVDSAEYWDSPSSMVVQLVGFAKAIATGKQYSGGEHEKINLRQ